MLPLDGGHFITADNLNWYLSERHCREGALLLTSAQRLWYGVLIGKTVRWKEFAQHFYETNLLLPLLTQTDGAEPHPYSGAQTSNNLLS